MSANKDNIPEYLNEELFQNVLRDGFKTKDLRIKGLALKLISEGGENYCSNIYRATVQYTIDGDGIQNIVLIVKNMKENYNAGMPLPSKEIDMYTQIVPLMEEILGESGDLVPKCFLATWDYNELYIFQDLENLRYTVQDRLKGLTEEQAQMLLKKIGVFHAASMVIAKKRPDLIEKIRKTYFDEGIEKVPFAADLVFGQLEYVTKLAQEWEGFEEIVIKLQKLRKTYDEKVLEMVNSKQSKFKVINHGDLWVNNMMFKHDEDGVDVKLIDLQLSHYGSPGIDLQYFLTTSIPLDLAVTKKYDLLRVYYKSLKSTLMRLNYSSVPSWDDLLTELRITELYALQSALVAVPLICLEKEVSKGNDMDALQDYNLMERQRAHMYKSERTLQATRYMLDRLNEIGFLD